MPLQSHHQALLLLENVQEERERVIEEEVLRRERLLLTPQSRMAWPPPSRLLKRHTPIRGPARPERAPSKGTVLPGSEPERDIPRNMGEHRRIAAQPQPRSRCLPRNRAAGREGCGLGAVRAARGTRLRVGMEDHFNLRRAIQMAGRMAENHGSSPDKKMSPVQCSWTTLCLCFKERSRKDYQLLTVCSLKNPVLSTLELCCGAVLRGQLSRCFPALVAFK
ncbi:uncharacterized protein LOC116664810 [Camelus ferus]|uniref:Uncharacterized protein LOC116664810 n=1 Tax=Camelus ferus TaxID=419612 RepID=A0A8B8TBN7_CAMFR|nr:uncharacterized protein LOC116664810 [Camelus ferus]